MSDHKKQILKIRQQTKLLKKVAKKAIHLKQEKTHVTEGLKADTLLESSFNNTWK